MTDAPEFDCVNEAIYHLEYRESYTGHVLNYIQICIFLSSELNYSYVLLTIGGSTVATFKISGGSFKILDSHARDLFGVPHTFGKYVFIAITDIQNLTFRTVFLKFADSLFKMQNATLKQ